VSAVFIVLGVLVAGYAARAVYASLRTAHRLTTPHSLQAVADGRCPDLVEERQVVAARLTGAITSEQYRSLVEATLVPVGAGWAPPAR
jgi:hypothetical protein